MKTPYDILRQPLITEKSTYQATKLRQYVFEVDPKATRAVVKNAVEKAFNVKVLKVNIINVPAKRGRQSRSHRLVIKKSAIKKAIVTLSPEDRIPIFEGV